jgi:hypothetical protein
MGEIARLQAIDADVAGEVLDDFRSMLNARGLSTTGGRRGPAVPELR